MQIDMTTQAFHPTAATPGLLGSQNEGPGSRCQQPGEEKPILARIFVRQDSSLTIIHYFINCNYHHILNQGDTEGSKSCLRLFPSCGGYIAWQATLKHRLFPNLQEVMEHYFTSIHEICVCVFPL